MAIGPAAGPDVAVGSGNAVFVGAAIVGVAVLAFPTVAVGVAEEPPPSPPHPPPIATIVRQRHANQVSLGHSNNRRVGWREKLSALVDPVPSPAKGTVDFLRRCDFLSFEERIEVR
jgi:hypothetical protein